MTDEKIGMVNCLDVNQRQDVDQNQGTVFISKHPLVFDILSRLPRIADSSASVLITGESGTGKDVIARMIHSMGSHQNRPFIAINCSAFSKDVVDNELFGHEKEAFTGAVSKKAGCFELAHGGTLFLDEIGEMHPQTQAKLLRAIENKAFRRLGGKEEIQVDTRIIAATNKNISAALKDGSLREDLFYRMSVIEIALPPLRDRKEDIPLLLDYFLRLFSIQYRQPEKKFSLDALQCLQAFDWPGNVRELRNLVERMVLVCPDDVVAVHFLPEKIAEQSSLLPPMNVSVGMTLAESEKILICNTLKFVGNNKTEAARILGISRRTLHSKLKIMGSVV